MTEGLEVDAIDPPRVWLIGVRSAAARWTAAGRGSVLSDEEEAQARAFRFPADQDRYRVAHTVLRHLLADVLVVPPRQVVVTRRPCAACGAPHGRPQVDGDIEFSLSHSGDLVAIGLAVEPIGVDVEVDADFGGVVASLHPSEQAAIAAAAPPDRHAATGRCWVRKEAFLKGTGAGLSEGLDTVDVGPGPPWGPQTTAEVSSLGWVIHDLRMPSTGYGAAATRTTQPPRTRWVHPNPAVHDDAGLR